VVPFESLDAVSYSDSIVTTAVSVAVCEIFNVKEWCDLENKVRDRSRSFKMAPRHTSHMYQKSTPQTSKPTRKPVPVSGASESDMQFGTESFWYRF